MAYDEELAERLRATLAGRRDVTEKRMFGGLAFLIGGRLAVAASRNGGLLLRVDPAEADALVRHPDAERAVMRGREMAGWLRVDAHAVATEDELRSWVRRGLDAVDAAPDPPGPASPTSA